MAENESKIEPETGQGRSPSFPMYTIDDAIKRAQLVYKEDKRFWATFENVAKHLGFSKPKRGGRTGRAISALRQYGLLEERDGKYRISDDAYKILELSPNDPKRDDLIFEAALKPSIIKKVLEHYDWELPSNETLRSYLIFDEKFTPDGAADFIKIVRRTLELAKPNDADYNAEESSEGEDTPQSGETPRMQTQQRQPQMAPAVPTRAGGAPPKPPVGHRTYPLYLSLVSEGTLTVPAPITKTEYDLLKSQIDNSLKILLATAVLPDPQTYPRSAIWKNNDNDQPVIVIGELGPGPDGKRYFKVQGSASGIPENELEFQQ
jgi:hypothetical protein